MIRTLAKARIAKDLNQLQRACTEYQNAIEIELAPNENDPRDSTFYITYSRTLVKLKQHQRAVTNYNKAIHLHENVDGNKVAKSHLLYFELASSLVQINDHDSALQNFNKSIAIKTNFFKGLFRRGQVQVLLNHHNAAIKDLTAALHLKPTHAKTLHTRAMVYYQKGWHQKAVLDLQACLLQKNKFQNNQLVQLNTHLGWCLLALKHFGNAVTAFQRAQSLDVNNTADVLQGIEEATTKLNASTAELSVIIEKDNRISKRKEKEQQEEEKEQKEKERKVQKAMEASMVVNMDTIDATKTETSEKSDSIFLLSPFRTEKEKNEKEKEEEEEEETKRNTWHTIKPGKQHHFEPTITILPTSLAKKESSVINSSSIKISTIGTSTSSVDNYDSQEEEEENINQNHSVDEENNNNNNDENDDANDSNSDWDSEDDNNANATIPSDEFLPGLRQTLSNTLSRQQATHQHNTSSISTKPGERKENDEKNREMDQMEERYATMAQQLDEMDPTGTGQQIQNTNNTTTTTKTRSRLSPSRISPSRVSPRVSPSRVSTKATSLSSETEPLLNNTLLIKRLERIEHHLGLKPWTDVWDDEGNILLTKEHKALIRNLISSKIFNTSKSSK